MKILQFCHSKILKIFKNPVRKAKNVEEKKSKKLLEAQINQSHFRMSEDRKNWLNGQG